MISDSKYSKIFYAIIGTCLVVAIIVYFYTDLILITLPFFSFTIILMFIEVYSDFKEEFDKASKFLKNVFTIGHFLFISLFVIGIIPWYINIDTTGIIGILFNIYIFITFLLWTSPLLYVEIKFLLLPKEKKREIMDARIKKRIAKKLEKSDPNKIVEENKK